MTIDQLLKKISKTQSLSELDALFIEFDPDCKQSSSVFQTLLLGLVLRSLTDKGYKNYASILSQEWMCREDMDGDGLIYGVDFYFENPPTYVEAY